MCGIIGYKGNKNAVDVVYNGIKRLEYRGYDSWGIACHTSEGVEVYKEEGKISKLPEELSSKGTNTAISHTRWATHGGVCEENAHPHLSKDGTIAIVHNGIIENYAELKEELQEKGYDFNSETDTEVIAHLIQDCYEGDFPEAARQAAKRLKGSYGILAINKNSEELVGLRNESPLVLGINDGECFLASDVPAFLEHTNEVMYIDDGEMVVVSSNPVIKKIATGKTVEKQTQKVDWDIKQAEKGEYRHFMLKEIHEQPDVLKNTLKQDKDQLEKVARMIHGAPRVCIVACGTSRHAALVGRYVISELAKTYCEVYMASEFQYFVDKLGKDTLIIAVSQSGETADVLVPIKQAKKHGCKTVSIVNVVGSSLDRESDVNLHLNCGPEISVASTKAFTSQVTMFYLLAYTMRYEFEKGLEKLMQIPKKIQDTIEINEEKCIEIAHYMKDWDDAYFIARGENFAVATEGALKMKEISYMHSEGLPAGELKHGTLALIDSGTPVIAICPRDSTYDETLSNVHEAKARGAHVIGISDKSNELFDEWLKIPDVDYLFYPLLANI
ncbi:glutamine--fructose-6-phosphate transaminase (isomerizing), partial [archaeon]|nr:glutamine--fructose-6-phosphate transaminase (isomerizing) [archaeon]